MYHIVKFYSTSTDERQLTRTSPCVLRSAFHIISNTTGLSFELKRIGLLSEIILAHFYLLVIYFLVKPKTHKNLSFIIYIIYLLETA